MLTGNEAELVIEAVKVFVGAKNEQPRLVILELHKALVISKPDGIFMISWYVNVGQAAKVVTDNPRSVLSAKT